MQSIFDIISNIDSISNERNYDEIDQFQFSQVLNLRKLIIDSSDKLF